MKRKAFLYLLLGTITSVSLLGCSNDKNGGDNADSKTTVEDLSSYFNGYDGCFVLYDTNKNEYVVYNEEKAKKQVPPCSTFKIPHALIGLETKILQDENTKINWDGTLYDIEPWNKDHTLKTAMDNSVVWYFQQLAPQIGEDKMLDYLDVFDYGNKDLSGGISEFWLQSSLKITPMAQVEFLKKLYYNQLKARKENQNLVKDLIVLSENDLGILSGKTGTGMIGENAVNGWFIGYIELKDNTLFFVTNIEADEAAFSSKAKEITFQILKDKDIWQ